MDDKKRDLELRATELEKTREKSAALKKALERAREKQDVNAVLSIVDEICRLVSPTTESSTSDPAPASSHAPVAEKNDRAEEVKRLNSLFDREYPHYSDILRDMEKALGLKHKSLDGRFGTINDIHYIINSSTHCRVTFV